MLMMAPYLCRAAKNKVDVVLALRSNCKKNRNKKLGAGAKEEVVYLLNIFFFFLSLHPHYKQKSKNNTGPRNKSPLYVYFL